MPPRKTKKLKPKDWYWEAEQDKIAADPDLRHIRAEDGPTEGLECVGLYFLLFNAMARSHRKGYLSDPFDDTVPMTLDMIADTVGRSPAVVRRVLSVILDKGLFSKNEQGIIYSRGLVRKIGLSKVRSKVGKK